MLCCVMLNVIRIIIIITNILLLLSLLLLLLLLLISPQRPFDSSARSPDVQKFPASVRDAKDTPNLPTKIIPAKIR